MRLPEKPHFFCALAFVFAIALVAKAPDIASAYQEFFLLGGMFLLTCL